MSRRSIASALLAAVVLAACGGTTDTTTTSPSTTGTTMEENGVVFGEGSLPATLPADFPIPAQAVVGATMEDTVRNRTEVILTMAAAPADVVDFYQQNLPATGYDITGSDLESTDKVIAFANEGVDGEVVIRGNGPNITSASISMTITG